MGDTDGRFDCRAAEDGDSDSLAEQRNHAQQLEVDRLRHIEHGIRPKAAVGVVGGVRRCEYHDENIFES